MPTAYDLILASRTLAYQGEAGFDDDAGYDAWHDALAQLGVSVAEKALARRHAENGLRGSAATLKALAAAITDRARRLEVEADRVDLGTLEMLRAATEATGGTKLALADGGWVKLATRTSTAVVVDSLADVPSQFHRVKTEADKAAIKIAIDRGEVVPGAHIEERTSESVAWGK